MCGLLIFPMWDSQHVLRLVSIWFMKFAFRQCGLRGGLKGSLNSLENNALVKLRAKDNVWSWHSVFIWSSRFQKWHFSPKFEKCCRWFLDRSLINWKRCGNEVDDCIYWLLLLIFFFLHKRTFTASKHKQNTSKKKKKKGRNPI